MVVVSCMGTVPVAPPAYRRAQALRGAAHQEVGGPPHDSHPTDLPCRQSRQVPHDTRP